MITEQGNTTITQPTYRISSKPKHDLPMTYVSQELKIYHVYTLNALTLLRVVVGLNMNTGEKRLS